jgi:hypothetical protein
MGGSVSNRSSEQLISGQEPRVVACALEGEETLEFCQDATGRNIDLNVGCDLQENGDVVGPDLNLMVQLNSGLSVLGLADRRLNLVGNHASMLATRRMQRGWPVSSRHI